ncbi:MAG: protein-disulfide reductase DsbD domain-containing protein [Gemmataceae bacterium]
MRKSMAGKQFLCGAAVVALGSWLMMSGLSQALAAPRKSDSVVKINATASRPTANGQQVVMIYLTIDPGWHLYANPVGHEDMEEMQTTLTVKNAPAQVYYPPGKMYKDKRIDAEFRIYEGKVTIQAVVQRAAGSSQPLELFLKMNACDDEKCLLPATVKVTVP